MNHLAHLLLAGPDPDLRFGAVLADHVKGQQALQALPDGVRSGVVLHRRIDAWTDANPAVLDLARSLGPPWQRYAGVILDVLFDFMLDRHWARFGPMPLEAFAAEIDSLMRQRHDQMPPRMQRFTTWAREVSLWRRYGQRETLEGIFMLLARRHGRTEPLARGAELLDLCAPRIEAAFLELMPDLQSAARRFREQALVRLHDG